MTLPFDCCQTGVTLNGMILVVAACSSALELEITRPPTQDFTHKEKCKICSDNQRWLGGTLLVP